MSGEQLPPERLQKVPAPASRVDVCHVPEGSICLPGQWHRQQDRHSGPCPCPLLRVWCFLTRKGLKSHQLQGAQPGHQELVQVLSSLEVMPCVCGTGFVGFCLHGDSVVPSERQLHTRWVKAMVILSISFPKPQGRGGS